MEGLSALGKVGLGGLLLFMYPNFILKWIIDYLESGGEVLCQILWFSLRKHFAVLSLCLHLSSLSLYLIIAVVLDINYGLECVTNLVIAYISYSTHILFDYKLVLVILYLVV